MREDSSRIEPVGEVIRTQRLRLNISIRELGRRSGLMHSTVSRIEQGSYSTTSPDALRAIARALGIPAADLFVVAGWMAQPSVKECLRAKYPAAPDHVLHEMESELRYVADKYGLTADDSAPPQHAA